jgi:hypothetical protein
MKDTGKQETSFLNPGFSKKLSLKGERTLPTQKMLRKTLWHV